MAAAKKPTHVVTHDGLYFKGGDGRPELKPRGTQLTLSAKQAEKMEKRGMIERIKKEDADEE
jgi:hypothetical protein